MATFVDPQHESALLRDGAMLQVVSATGTVSLQLPDFLREMPLLGAALSPDGRVLAFHSEEAKLEYYAFDTQRRATQKVNKPGKILGYYWREHTADFVLVNTVGVRFYAFDSRNLSFRKLHMRLFPVKALWVVPSTGALLVEDAQTENLRTFLIDGGFEGPKFANICRKELFSAATARLYGSSYFLRYGADGLTCFALKRNETSVSLETHISFVPAALFVSDDVIVAVGDERVAYVDVRAQPPLVQETGRPFDDSDWLSEAPALRQIASNLLLRPDGSLLPIQIDLRRISDSLPVLPRIKFLLRRNGGKQECLGALRRLLWAREPLEQVNEVFEFLCEVYVEAVRQEEQGTLCEAEGNQKCEDGTIVLAQNDIYDNVLISLYEARSKDSQYFSAVLMCLLHQLVSHDIAVHVQVQVLTARHLLETQNSRLLSDLMRLDILTPSHELSLLLEAASQPFSPLHCGSALLLAEGVMRRIEDWRGLTAILLAHNRVWELLQRLMWIPSQPACVQDLQQFAKAQSDLQLIQTIYDFIDSWSSAR